MPDKNIINLSEALEQLGDSEFYLELLDEFIAGLAEKKELINQALASGIDNDLRMVSHSLKGVSANLHLPSIQQAAAELENAAKEENKSELVSLAETLLNEFDRLLQERALIITE